MADERLLESTVEDVLIDFPELLMPGLKFVEKREKLKGAGIIDLVFQNSLRETVLVEVKRGTATRSDIGQVIDYFGSLKENQPDAQIIFVANEIKNSFKIALALLGIQFREIMLEQNPIYFSQSVSFNQAKLGEEPLDVFLLEYLKRMARPNYEAGRKQSSIPKRVLEDILLEVEQNYGVCVCDVIEGGCKSKIG